MSRKIIGNTVGTTMNPKKIATSGLPTVTEADNGKILQVVEGTWELVENSGGSALPSAEEGAF